MLSIWTGLKFFVGKELSSEMEVVGDLLTEINNRAAETVEQDQTTHLYNFCKIKTWSCY